MSKLDVTTFFVYRWRYWIGYSIIAILLIGLLVFAGLYVPGGISQEEIRSTVKSSGISYNDPLTLGVTNLPFQMLQQASIGIFGVTNFSIKYTNTCLL